MSKETKTALIVEDSEPLRKILAEKITDAGFSVIEAVSGDAGLKTALESKPDIILTDVVMFPMDGLEMSRKIRESGDWGRHVHIVVLTNSTGARDRAKTDDLGLDAYFVKAETSLDEVVKMVKHILE